MRDIIGYQKQNKNPTEYIDNLYDGVDISWLWQKSLAQLIKK